MVFVTAGPGAMPETPTFIHIVREYSSDGGAAIVEARPYSVFRGGADVVGVVLRERQEGARSVEEGMILVERFIADACGLEGVECVWHPFVGNNSFETWINLGSSSQGGFPERIICIIESSNDTYLTQFFESHADESTEITTGAFLNLKEAQQWCAELVAEYLGMHSVALSWTQGVLPRTPEDWSLQATVELRNRYASFGGYE